MIKSIDTKLFALKAEDLPASRPGLKVTCVNFGCTRRCTVTFRSLKRFSSAYAEQLVPVFSSLCAKLAKESEFVETIDGRKNLM